MPETLPFQRRYLLLTLLFLPGCGGASPMQPAPDDDGLRIVAESGTAIPGQELRLYVQAETTPGRVERLSEGVRWSTSDSRIAAVRPDGVLVPVDRGDVVVEAWYRGQSATTTVRVTDRPACSAVGVASGSPGAAAPLDLEVGGSRVLTALEAACLRLVPRAGAAYALAFADLRDLRRAEHGPEQSGDGDLDLSIAYHAAGTAGVAAQARAASGKGPGLSVTATRRPNAPSFATSQGSATRYAAADWREGRTLTFQGGQDAPREVYIERVYGDYYVLGIDERLRPTLGASQLAALDSAFRIVAGSGERVLAALSDGRPSSVEGGEKMLVVLVPATDPGRGASGLSYAHGVPSGSRVTSHVTISLGTQRAWSAELVSLLAHELAHTRQFEHMSATAPRLGVPSPYSVWAAEGGADLAAQEVVREHLGIRPLQPVVLDDRVDASAGQWRFFYSVGALARGSIGSGYNDAAGFLRYLLEARLRAGEDYGGAVAGVVRGAVEGWYGYDSRGVRRTGLTERMRARLGADWSPADAVLTYALAMATDERTSDPRFQSLSFSGLPGSAFTWRPHHTFRGGASEAVRIRGASRSVGFVFLEDGGRGGALTLSAAGADVAWMVVRHR